MRYIIWRLLRVFGQSRPRTQRRIFGAASSPDVAVWWAGLSLRLGRNRLGRGWLVKIQS